MSLLTYTAMTILRNFVFTRKDALETVAKFSRRLSLPPVGALSSASVVVVGSFWPHAAVRLSLRCLPSVSVYACSAPQDRPAASSPAPPAPAAVGQKAIHCFHEFF